MKCSIFTVSQTMDTVRRVDGGVGDALMMHRMNEPEAENAQLK